MKTKLLLYAVLLAASFQFINAQCNEVVSNFGNNTGIPMYNINGDVNITLNTDNTITLDLSSNFMTAAGPDIRAFLVNSNGMTDTQLSNALIGSLENVAFGIVGSTTMGINQNGAKSFTVAVPTSSSIENFDTVFFYCLQFNQFWDFGKFTPFSSTTCSLLSVEENTIEKIAVFPNPTSDVIHISGINLDKTEIRIFNIIGQPVLRQTASLEINVSNFKKGIYILNIINGDESTSLKLVVN